MVPDALTGYVTELVTATPLEPVRKYDVSLMLLGYTNDRGGARTHDLRIKRPRTGASQRQWALSPRSSPQLLRLGGSARAVLISVSE